MNQQFFEIAAKLSEKVNGSDLRLKLTEDQIEAFNSTVLKRVEPKTYNQNKIPNDHGVFRQDGILIYLDGFYATVDLVFHEKFNYKTEELEVKLYGCGVYVVTDTKSTQSVSFSDMYYFLNDRYLATPQHQ